MRKFIFSLIFFLAMVASAYADQITIGTGAWSAVRGNINANFGELYGKWAGLGSAYDTSAELDALFAAKQDSLGTTYNTADKLDGHFSGKQDTMGADDNYVTDAEKVVIGNTSGVNTGDQDLSGKQNADADLNIWAGITPSSDMQAFLALSSSANILAFLGLDDLNTLSGVAAGAVGLGIFTGSTIENDQTIKEALQALEIAVEGAAGGHDAGTDTALGVLGIKTIPIDADKLIFRDSTDSDGLVTATLTQVKAFFKIYFDGLYQGVMGADDNYVTDAEKVIIGNTSGTNTGDQDLSGKQDLMGADDNYVTDAEKIVIGNTSGTNTGDQDLSGKQDLMGADDNYVTDAEKVVIGNTSGVNTGDQDLSGKQNADADLDIFAGITPSANVQSFLGAANYAAMRTLLNIEPGTALSGGGNTMPDDTYSGVTIGNMTAGESISQWDLIFFDSTGWRVADAEVSGKWPIRGVATAAVSSGGVAVVLTQGVVRNDAWNFTTIGGPLYVGTSGGLTETPPTSTGSCVQLIGWVISDDEAYINISGHFVEIQ